MNKVRKSKGFTLIELIITLAISTIMMITLGSLLSTSLRTYNNDKQQSQIQVDARNIITIISQNARAATTTSISPDGGTLTLNDVNNLPYKTYSLSDHKLLDTGNVIKDDVSKIQFKKDNITGNIFIYLTTQQPNTKKQYSVASSVADNTVSKVPAKYWFNCTFNIIDPTAAIDSRDIALNPTGKLLYIVDSFKWPGGNNVDSLAVKANTADLGGFASRSGCEYLFDVNNIINPPSGTVVMDKGEYFFSKPCLDVYNSSDDIGFFKSINLSPLTKILYQVNPNTVQNNGWEGRLEKYADYKKKYDGFDGIDGTKIDPITGLKIDPIWKSAFPDYPDTSTIGGNYEIATLSSDPQFDQIYANMSKANYDFKGENILNHIHFYNGGTNLKNFITENGSGNTSTIQLNDYKGDPGDYYSTLKANNNYEYIIVHGDLYIDSLKDFNKVWDLKGLIYCDGTIYTSEDLGAHGIIVAKNVKTYKGIPSHGNWHETYDESGNSANGMDTIARMLDFAAAP